MNGDRCKQLYYAWGTLELWQLYPFCIIIRQMVICIMIIQMVICIMTKQRVICIMIRHTLILKLQIGTLGVKNKVEIKIIQYAYIHYITNGVCQIVSIVAKMQINRMTKNDREQKSQMAYSTADIMTETCDRAKNVESLPFVGSIFYLNWFTQNITYLITPFNIHMPIAEGINVAQRVANI